MTYIPRFSGLITFFIAVLMLLVSCGHRDPESAKDRADTIPGKTPVATAQADSLLYKRNNFSSYIDAVKRGAGVISFTLNINDRLDIWNLDDTKFGEIVLNKDLTYFIAKMPKKIIAREVVPEYDFAAFDFDAENVDTEPNYLIIYVNKEKRKVKKDEVKFSFKSW